MTDTLPLREQIIEALAVMTEPGTRTLGDIADRVMAVLPSLPDGWVDFVQGVADARNGEGMFWTTPDRDQDQDVIDRMGDAAVAMLSARPTPPTASGWRCFHCDEVLTTAEAAEAHFGQFDDCTPICKVGAEHYRDLERQLASYRSESDPDSKAFYALGAEHAVALRRAEEVGYEAGLRDGRALSTEPLETER